MKNLVKSCCWYLSLILILASFSFVVFADETAEFAVTANYDSKLGEVQFINETNNSGDTATGDMSQKSWFVSSSLVENQVMDIFSGVKLTAMEAMTYKVHAKTIADMVCKGYVGGSTNPTVTNNNATGAVYKFDCEESGALSVAVKQNAGKAIYAANASNVDLKILDENNTTGESEFKVITFDVKAGNSYFFWGNGSKVQVYGVAFQPKYQIAAKTGDVVKIVSTPKSNALLGNITLDDETIMIGKNSDYTECSFTMPEKDVTVNTSFVSNDVVAEVEGISFNEIKGENSSQTQVDSDLALFDGWNTKIGYADVAWESSNEGIISKSGDVNPQQAEVTANVTAIFTYQDYPNITLKKTFDITVLADTDDNSAVASAKESLTLGDTSLVKKDLNLPTSGKKNTNITWSSTDESVVDSSGKVTRYPAVDKNIILTATISRGEASETKDFTITVIGYVAITIDRVALSNSDNEVVLEPMDNGYVSHIIYTDSIPNKTGNEILIAAVYDKDEQFLLSCKSYSLKQYSEESGEQTILRLPSGDLKTYADSVIKVFAFDGIDTLKPMLYDSYTYENTIIKTPTVYVAGDSTASNYKQTGSGNASPQVGWAQVLQDYFAKTDVVISNLAISGRSSLSFRAETAYKTIVNSIKAGDYFIIQFGHNDGKSDDATRYTDPSGDRFIEGSYKNSLMNYVNAALDKGAYPILTTSVSRRWVSDAGLELYVNAVRELGQELGLPVVDLYSKTKGYIDSVGIDKATDLYLHVKPQDSRFTGLSVMDYKNSKTYYTIGATDNTHLNYFGARMISQWACDEFDRIGHPLATKRNSFSMTIDDVPAFE